MVIEDQLTQAAVCPSQHAEHNELRNHTLNVKACYEGKGCLQTLTALSCSRPDDTVYRTCTYRYKVESYKPTARSPTVIRSCKY